MRKYNLFYLFIYVSCLMVYYSSVAKTQQSQGSKSNINTISQNVSRILNQLLNGYDRRLIAF